MFDRRRNLSFEEFKAIRLNMGRADGVTLERLYKTVYLESEYADHFHGAIFHALAAAEKIKLLQEAIDI